MAPNKEDTHLSKNIIALSGYLAEKFPSSRALKNIARSTDFKRFLFCLSETAPSLMKGTLKRASRKCEHALGVEENARVARKRVASPNSNGKSTKRIKTSHTSQRETESDVVAQVHIVMVFPPRFRIANPLNSRKILHCNHFRTARSKKTKNRTKLTQYLFCQLGTRSKLGL